MPLETGRYIRIEEYAKSGTAIGNKDIGDFQN